MLTLVDTGKDFHYENVQSFVEFVRKRLCEIAAVFLGGKYPEKMVFVQGVQKLRSKNIHGRLDDNS